MSKTAVAFEDRAWMDAEIDRLIVQLDARQNGRGLKHLVTQRFIAIVRGRAADGDRQAARVLDGLAVDGAWEHVSERLSEDKGTVAYNGRALQMPARTGARARDKDGLPQRHYQQRLWWDWTWPEFKDWLQGQHKQARAMEVKVLAFEQVLRLEDKHPDTLTPGEACEREGIDPRSFGLDEAI